MVAGYGISLLKGFTAGAVGGVCDVLVGYPLDTIKVIHEREVLAQPFLLCVCVRRDWRSMYEAYVLCSLTGQPHSAMSAYYVVCVSELNGLLKWLTMQGISRHLLGWVALKRVLVTRKSPHNLHNCLHACPSLWGVKVRPYLAILMFI